MIVVPCEPLSPEWFAYRRTRITASKAAATLGMYVPEGDLRDELCAWTSPLQVWSELTGRTEPDEQDNEWLRYGVRQEPVIRDWYRREQACEVEEVHGIVQHARFPWLCATPDGMVQRDRLWSWEAKTAHAWSKDKWADGVPLAYKVQAHIQMMCMDAAGCVVCVEIAPSIFWRDVPRDDALVEQLEHALGHFWQHHVAADEPPPAISPKHDGAILSRIYEPDPEQFALAGDWVSLTATYDQLKADAVELDAKCERIKLSVREHMKGRSVAVLPDGSEWRLSKPNAKTGSRSLTRKIKNGSTND